MWTAWNEPNSRTFSVPVSPRLYVQRVLNPGVRVAARGLRREPGRRRRDLAAQDALGMSPLAFMQGMARGARPARRVRAESVSGRPRRDPDHATCSTAAISRWRCCRRFAPTSRATSASKPLWLTEYGYQTNPPDRLLGVSYALQAALYGRGGPPRLAAEPGVTVLIHFLVRDEPSLGGWQSGLFTRRRRPEACVPRVRAAARAGLAARRERDLWGQVRPGSGPRAYVIQRAVGSALAGRRRNGADGRRWNLHPHGRASARDARTPLGSRRSAGRAPPLTLS